MKVRIAIFVLVIAGGAFGIHKVNEFRNSPSGQLIETLQVLFQEMKIMREL